MAAEEKKEAFLERWSRLKQEKEEELPAKEENPAPALPAVDKLTPDSDFSGFMNPKVEDALRRVALKKLFSDPHFNLPDPYEAYSGDWTVGEPISEEMLATLNQAQRLLFGNQEEKKEPPGESVADKGADAAGPVAEKPKTDDSGKQDA